MNVILASTISNVSRTLEKELRTISRALGDFDVLEIILVESDSTDDTVNLVNSLRDQYKSINLICLGTLKTKIPDRISRIRFCRQIYVQRVREIMASRSIDYVIVADLDGMNSRISTSALATCFTRNDWSGVLANQLGGYYDLLALRHKTWCPNDILQELMELKSEMKPLTSMRYNFYKRLVRRLEYDRIRSKAIYSKMIRLPRKSPWIEVESGFGGFAIYDAQVFGSSDYSLQDTDLQGTSEHVSFSRRIRESGGHIFINPDLINNHWNTYNISRYFLIRQLREIYWSLSSRFRVTRI